VFEKYLSAGQKSVRRQMFTFILQMLTLEDVAQTAGLAEGAVGRRAPGAVSGPTSSGQNFRGGKDRNLMVFPEKTFGT